jgi:hypothetical protein
MRSWRNRYTRQPEMLVPVEGVPVRVRASARCRRIFKLAESPSCKRSMCGFEPRRRLALVGCSVWQGPPGFDPGLATLVRFQPGQLELTDSARTERL